MRLERVALTDVVLLGQKVNDEVRYGMELLEWWYILYDWWGRGVLRFIISF